MIKLKIGICPKCKENTELCEGYNAICVDCYNKYPPSKFMIDGVPLVRVIEDILMARPLFKKIYETTMVERGAHRIIRLEEDGKIYKVEPEYHEQIVKVPVSKSPDVSRSCVHPADPELILKLNNLIDEHVKNCNYCQGIVDENSVL